jgi:hypothetical protein
MFLNISNHNSKFWSNEQLSAAESIGGTIVDMPFPNVPPDADRDLVQSMAEDMLAGILEKTPSVVHVMGEHTLNVALVNKLKSIGVMTVASTTKRDVVEEIDGTKTSRFRFVRFREY